MSKQPTATLFSTSENRKVWTIQFPSTGQKWGKSYIATTYPDSELIYLETAAKHRAVANGVAAKLLPKVREAINRAHHSA